MTAFPISLILINTIMTYHITIHNDTITFLLDSIYSHIEYTYDNIIITPNISIRSSLYVNIVYFSFSSPNALQMLHRIPLIPLHHHRWRIHHPDRSQEVVFSEFTFMSILVWFKGLPWSIFRRVQNGVVRQPLYPIKFRSFPPAMNSTRMGADEL